MTFSTSPRIRCGDWVWRWLEVRLGGRGGPVGEGRRGRGRDAVGGEHLVRTRGSGDGPTAHRRRMSWHAHDGDEGRADRQAGVVDRRPRRHVHGPACMEWAGARTAAGSLRQGNILVGEQVVGAMSGAFAETDGDLCDRLLAACSG